MTPRLTETQEQALIRLAEEADRDEAAGYERRWIHVAELPGTHRTYDGLCRAGLAEDDPRRGRLRSLKITDAGLALCASMGD